jgi:hypothetical protein
MSREATTRYVKPIGRLDDASSAAYAIAKRLNWRTNGARAVLVYVVGDDVYAANLESVAAQRVRQEAIVGLYTRTARMGDIAEDLGAWSAAA